MPYTSVASKHAITPSALSRDQLLTIADLDAFRNELLQEIRRLFKEITNKPTKQYLKSHEVRKLLGISPGTLQTLRNNGTIPFTKIGGVIYYNTFDLELVMKPGNNFNK